jgi:hypothetical protein
VARVRDQRSTSNRMEINMLGHAHRMKENVSVCEGANGGWTGWNGKLTGVGHVRYPKVFK